MNVRVVVISKDEGPRLRLALTGLAHQRYDGGAIEVVVVDDGSSDGTSAEARAQGAHVVRHETSRGRSAARNAGATAVTAHRPELLLFIDGDVVCHPRFVAAHVALHQESRRSPGGPAILGRGETYHLRCARFFQDPETGQALPGREEKVARMANTFAASLVTRAQIAEGAATLDARAEAGIYAGSGPRRLYELEVDALLHHPASSLLWMTAAAHNMSLPREAFEALGGFHEGLTVNEHRELALRHCQQGGAVRFAAGARTYHLLKGEGFRDPLTADAHWERLFYEAHPTLATKLMMIFWQSLAGDPHIPAAARILSLPQMEEALKAPPVDYDEVRRLHPLLPELGP